MISAGSGSVDLPSLVSALWACAKERRVRKVYERANLTLPLNEEGLIRFCLHKGSRYAIDKILEEEEQLRELCSYLDLENHLNEEHSRSDIINIILRNLSSQEIRCSGVHTILQGIAFAQSKDSDQILPEILRQCFLIVENLMIDMYYLFIAEILYPFLDSTRQVSVQNTLRATSPRLGNAVEQLIKYDDEIKQGFYPVFQEELERMNGQTSIFGAVENLNTPLDLAFIRNTVLAHPSDHTRAEIFVQCRRFIDIAKPFFDQLFSVFPSALTPIEFGVNEWGYRYFAYIDDYDTDRDGYMLDGSPLIVDGKIESRKCKRLYFLRSKGEFIPLKKAYCFHPKTAFPMCDPILYYASSLREIGGNLS